MFYHLLYPLHQYWSVFNVFKYITFRSAYATVTALLICFIFGNWVAITIGTVYLIFHYMTILNRPTRSPGSIRFGEETGMRRSGPVSRPCWRMRSATTSPISGRSPRSLRR